MHMCVYIEYTREAQPLKRVWAPGSVRSYEALFLVDFGEQDELWPK